jgi:hypothetical protein
LAKADPPLPGVFAGLRFKSKGEGEDFHCFVVPAGLDQLWIPAFAGLTMKAKGAGMGDFSHALIEESHLRNCSRRNPRNHRKSHGSPAFEFHCDVVAGTNGASSADDSWPGH